MKKQLLVEMLKEYATGGCRNLRDIPLVARGPLSGLAREAFEEVLIEAKGMKADSPQVRRLELVSRIVIGNWGDEDGKSDAGIKRR